MKTLLNAQQNTENVSFHTRNNFKIRKLNGKCDSKVERKFKLNVEQTSNNNDD